MRILAKDHVQLLFRWKNQAIVSMVFHTEAYLFNSCSNVIQDSLTHKDLGFLIPFRTNPKSSSGIKALGICPCLSAPPSLPPLHPWSCPPWSRPPSCTVTNVTCSFEEALPLNTCKNSQSSGLPQIPPQEVSSNQNAYLSLIPTLITLMFC